MADYNSRFTGAQVDMAVEMALNGGGDVLSGTSAPTTSTVGKVGDTYIRTITGQQYICVKVKDGVYTWIEVNGELSASVDDIYYTTDDLSAKVGTTTDTGGTSSAGTVNAKLNALLSSGGGSITGSDGKKYAPVFLWSDDIPISSMYPAPKTTGMKVCGGRVFTYNDTTVRNHDPSSGWANYIGVMTNTDNPITGIDFYGEHLWVFLKNGTILRRYISTLGADTDIVLPGITNLSLMASSPTNCIVRVDSNYTYKNIDKATATLSDYSISPGSAASFCTNGVYIWYRRDESSLLTKTPIKRVLVSTGEIDITSTLLSTASSLEYIRGTVFTTEYNGSSRYIRKWKPDLSSYTVLESHFFITSLSGIYGKQYCSYVYNDNVSTTQMWLLDRPTINSVNVSIIHQVEIAYNGGEMVSDSKTTKDFDILSLGEYNSTLFALLKNKETGLVYLALINPGAYSYNLVSYKKQ